MVRRLSLALATSAVLTFVAAGTLGIALQPPPLQTIAVVVAHAR
jgi:hypothetical protein